MTDEIRSHGDSSVLYEDGHPFASGEDYYALYAEGPEGIKVELVTPE